MKKLVKTDLTLELKQRIIGQDHVINSLLPYIKTAQSGLNPDNRPAGIFLLLGPTGTGKTKTVEALAEILHGKESSMLKVNCAEYQLDHEVAKLIGSPPGYLGHKETPPVFTQLKLNELVTPYCNYSIVLFDEIEKASGAFHRILLNVLDKGIMNLGDGKQVNFQNTLIFMTSNLGAENISRLEHPIGLYNPSGKIDLKNLNGIVSTAVKKKFPPEFLNRIDETVVFSPLTKDHLIVILNIELQKTIDFINTKKVTNYRLDFKPEAVEWFLKHGTSIEYGAREFKRLIQKKILFPIAEAFSDEKLLAGSSGKISITCVNDSIKLEYFSHQKRLEKKIAS